jgi:hypothetical protein
MAVPFAEPITKLQTFLRTRIDSVPFVKRTAEKIESSPMFAKLIREARRGKDQIVTAAQEFPRDLKSVKPYFKKQQKRFEIWKRDLPVILSAQKTKVKSKVKGKRSASAKTST